MNNNKDKTDTSEKKVPKWVDQFFNVIHRHWRHHSPCDHINMNAEWDKNTKCWHVNSAPIWQEILGGEDDGSKVWPGFFFDFGDFSRSEGVWIQEQALMSVCAQCGSENPKTMAKGKFRGHSFYLHLYLDPPANTNVVEVIDTIKKEIRHKVAAIDSEETPEKN